MTYANPIVRLIYAQTIVFGLSWLLAYILGQRLRRGHWTWSLIVAGLLQLAGFAAIDPGRPLPAAGWWAPAAGVAVLTIALTDHWNAIGQACMASTVTLSALFLAYIIEITIGAHLGPLSLLVTLALLVLQAFALLLLCAGSFEILDVVCRIRWRRVVRPEPASGWTPRVSIHVPAYNEPPEMVIQTLDALARLDYPNYEVIVIDDNTADEGLWRPLERRCSELGFKFFHLENWPGYKSGALNFALSRTDPAAELVGVVDSDYVVEPDYLKRCTGFFRDERVAFVQTPQDYRDFAPDDRYAQACYDAYLYFFKIAMVSRNEHNGIIFAGTMGLIRRSVLQDLGGWDEWCITEDAEISLRILDRGYQGIYVDQSFGHGLMPLNFDGLKKQRFRWAFGGMQILRAHWAALAPWSRWADRSHQLTLAQKWDYLLGGLQWLNDPITFGFTCLLLLGSASLIVAHSLFIQPLTPAVMIVPFLFIFVGFSRFLWALRVRLGCGLDRAVSAFVILLGLTWVVTLACSLGLVKREGVFLRTPKQRSKADPWHAYRVTAQEIFLAALCAAAAIALLATQPPATHIDVMTGLLLWQGMIYVSAPISSLWGRESERRALHPEYITASRTTGERFGAAIASRTIAWGVAGLLIAAILAFILAVRIAPESERAYRSPASLPALVPRAAFSVPDASEVEAHLYFEKEAALKGDVEAALHLWSPDGVVRDANYTPDDPADDRLWVGTAGLRDRYTQEFARHHFLELRHRNASVSFHGDTAIVVNDLDAKLATPSGVQHVNLPRSDQWKLVRGKKGWKIVELIVNRAPR